MCMLVSSITAMDPCKFLFKEWQPKNVSEALLPLRLISCLFSLEMIHSPLNQPQIGLSIFYGISTTLAYVILLSYTAMVASNSDWFSTTEAILFGIVYVNLFMYLCNMILMWIWGKTTKNVFERMMRADEILEELKIPLNFRKIYVSSWKILFLWIFICLTMTIVDMMWFNNRVDSFTTFIIVVVLLHPIQANSIITLLASVSIEIMEWRFNRINELLLDIVDRKRKGLRDDIDRQGPQIPWTIFADNFRYSASSQNTTHNIVRIAKYLHLEFTTLCDECARIFGIQLAMELASSFVIVTGVTFIFYIVMVSPTIDRMSKIRRVIVLIIWLVCTFLKIFRVNRICAKTLTEWKKTGTIIHELGIICKNDGYRDEIRQFSLQIMQNPVSITACGLVTLGNGFILRFIGSVTTYVIILVQMYDTPI